MHLRTVQQGSAPGLSRLGARGARGARPQGRPRRYPHGAGVASRRSRAMSLAGMVPVAAAQTRRAAPGPTAAAAHWTGSASWVSARSRAPAPSLRLAEQSIAARRNPQSRTGGSPDIAFSFRPSLQIMIRHDMGINGMGRALSILGRGFLQGAWRTLLHHHLPKDLIRVLGLAVSDNAQTPRIMSALVNTNVSVGSDPIVSAASFPVCRHGGVRAGSDHILQRASDKVLSVESHDGLDMEIAAVLVQAYIHA